jgi:hypothetical protein
MKIIYKTPMGAYMVASTVSLFYDIPIYHVCKYDESLAKMKREGQMVSEYYVIGSYEHVKSCFKWLKDHNIISKDEYNGWTPLHVACLHGASPKKILLLINAHPSACFKRTVTSKQTPLEVGFNPESAHFSSWEKQNIIQLLLNPFEHYRHKIVKQGLDSGIIHDALYSPCIFPELIEYALERFPRDVYKV